MTRPADDETGTGGVMDAKTHNGTYPPAAGIIVAVQGSILDVAFPAGRLPAVYERIDILWDGPGPLAAEVQLHAGPTIVRAVALRDTGGLARGTPVLRTGGPIVVPV